MAHVMSYIASLREAGTCAELMDGDNANLIQRNYPEDNNAVIILRAIVMAIINGVVGALILGFLQILGFKLRRNLMLRAFYTAFGLLKASLAFCAVGLYASVALAGAVTPEMQQKIDAYKVKAATMAADPALIKSVKEANAKGPITGMDNTQWVALPESNPIVSEMVNNAAGKLLTQWMNEDAKGVNKLVLTGNQGHRFAFTSQPASYLSKDKMHFTESFAGKVWQMKDSQPDPSTKIDTVQITVPVKEGGAIIGVLLLSLTADNLRN